MIYTSTTFPTPLYKYLYQLASPFTSINQLLPPVPSTRIKTVATYLSIFHFTHGWQHLIELIMPLSWVYSLCLVPKHHRLMVFLQSHRSVFQSSSSLWFFFLLRLTLRPSPCSLYPYVPLSMLMFLVISSNLRMLSFFPNLFSKLNSLFICLFCVYLNIWWFKPNWI